MNATRDYLAWHDRYDDTASSLPRRLAIVQGILDVELNARSGPVRVLSLCAGDGRDVLGTLAERSDAGRVSVALVELHPELVRRATRSAGDVEARVEVIAADAGCSSTYGGLATVPADVVLLVGVLGNISESDVAKTLAALPALCAPGATVVWTRMRSLDGAADFVTPVREGLATAGFTEKNIGALDDRDDPAAVGRGPLRRAAHGARTRQNMVHLPRLTNSPRCRWRVASSGALALGHLSGCEGGPAPDPAKSGGRRGILPRSPRITASDVPPRREAIADPMTDPLTAMGRRRREHGRRA
jgi:hypothetical protein